MTQIEVDLKRLERGVVWKEYMHGKDHQEPYKENIFRTRKTKFPKHNTVPEGLKTFVNSIRSEIQDPRNRKSVKCNLSQGEIIAMQQLQRLQQERKLLSEHVTKVQE